MLRLIAATLLIALAASPVLACDWSKSTAVESQPSTVASQPAAAPSDQTTAPKTDTGAKAS